ncbi:uncharacterized protein LOC128183840 [Crassostrea angulata]|uniref:uncharacterized protein LOC128183840 n=1 Tax=Magallana angulata TaxID=2784310 RepID=UPI0022B18187|nr:uncharacterized protein LOC128183840 [Crassostrea angulata]
MDPEFNLQDVLRCHLCETHVSQMYCDICQINLCKPCVGEHISDESKEHKVVPIQKRRSTPKCPTHSSKQCELYCEQCNIPICLKCVSSAKHEQHKKIDALINLERKKKALKKDLQELENTIYPKYQEIASIVSVQRANVDKTYKKLKRTIDKQERDWHRDIDTIVKSLRADADSEESRMSAFFDEHEGKIKHSIDEIKQTIVDIKKVIHSNDAYVSSAYKSRNNGFRRLPESLFISLPSIYPCKIRRESVLQNYSSFTTKMVFNGGGFGMDSPCSMSTTKEKYMDKPGLISYIETGYRTYNVSRLSDEEVWMSGTDNIMRLYNLDGDLLKSIQTESGNVPSCLAVTRNGDLVYTDHKDKTVNMMKDTEIQTLIRLKGWRPHGVCSTSSDDLLVVMDSDDGEQTKVVRYSGSKKIQNIQYDNEGEDLYSLCYHFFHITENRNLDICVTDNIARAVVVVNQAGKLRFRYTGPSSLGFEESFDPRGITTDSLCRILISDCENRRIHIIDQDGQFLRYIDNCGLYRPIALCINTEDNVFVADDGTCQVNVIEYYMPVA